MIRKLVDYLSDGKFHSGEGIATNFGLSRAAVWKQVKKLRDMGVEVDSVRGRGYRIRESLDLLDKKKILAAMGDQQSDLLHALEVKTVIDSTSRYLKQMLQYPEKRKDSIGQQYFIDGSAPGYGCIAEYQNSGRGRRGRDWHAPFGSSLCFSVLWRFELSPLALSGLSLALGVAIARVLRELGVDDVGLKWPNDIYWRQKKLGGILFEVFAEQGGAGYVISGVGLNVNMNQTTAEKIDQAWVDLKSLLPSEKISRNDLAAMLLEASAKTMQQFSSQGFDGFVQGWDEFDICKGREVTLQAGSVKIGGIAKGIDAQGQLILATDQGEKTYASGEVSLRFV